VGGIGTALLGELKAIDISARLFSVTLNLSISLIQVMEFVSKLSKVESITFGCSLRVSELTQ
jgi:hypothetical protein